MAQEMEREIQQLKNRFHDLAERSFAQGIYTFTGFLGLGGQEAFWQEEPKLRYAGYTLYGGCENADRVMIRFGQSGQLGYEAPFPVVCIHISPLQEKFAEELSHRDFLGALMNLGIDRSTIGDIRAGGKQACLFCTDSIAEYICQNLEQVKHTHVRCRIAEEVPELLQEEPEAMRIQAQSLRVDAVLAKVYNVSREKSLELFRAGRVYVNGRLCENHSRILRAGETVSVRGHGRFTLSGEQKETRKGKLSAEVFVYR